LNFNNKWIRGAIPALLIHCSIGSVYAWSLFVNPISQYLNKSSQQIQFAFSLAIFFLGMSAAFCGKFVEKNIKRSTILSMLCFCGGLIMTSLSIYFKSIIGIYLGYGCLMGIGLGIGYIAPVKTLMLWFEKQKGLATGIAITGFGFASAIASPIIKILLSKTTLSNTFLILGLIYIIPMLIAFLLIKKPGNWIETIDNNSDGFKRLSMFKNKTFLLIWLMLYINISCGLSLISIASPIMKDLGFTLSIIVLIIGVMGIFNGSGRLVFSTVADKFKNRSNIYEIIFILSIISIIIGLLCNKLIFITLIIVSTCYGAGFSNLPSLLSDKFGMKHISTIHGLSLTAWAIAGLTGNQISAVIKNISGSYLNVLWIIGIEYLIGLFISIKIKKEMNKKDDNISFI
jgi:OFA family oxalate/formate antiporter-like MFS transporter